VQTFTLVDYEAGPKQFDLRVDLVDEGTKPPVYQRTSIIFHITVLDANDPPEITSRNYTTVDENTPVGTIVYNTTFLDQDGDKVTCALGSGNVNTAQNNSAAFRVDPSTCAISVNTWIDFEAGSCFALHWHMLYYCRLGCEIPVRNCRLQLSCVCTYRPAPLRFGTTPF
jgi:hypothetical protein